MHVPVAFLAGGRLFVKDGDEAPRALESRFGQAVRDRAVRSAQQDAWKTQGTGAQLVSGGAGPWGAPPRDPAVLRIAITGVSRAADPGRLLYALDADDVVGLFSLDPATGDETRLFHGNDRRLQFPSGRPGQDRIVCSVVGDGGAANLALIRADGSDLYEITEGESLDLAPSWAPAGARVVYQTAGLGRDRRGRLAGRSPFSAQVLDLDTGELEPALEDARFDFLSPRVAADGTVYAIRRPHRGPAAGSAWKAAADVALLPFHLVRKLARPRDAAAPVPAPASWKLVRRRPGATPETLASHVLTFDLRDDGAVVLSNGSAIDHLTPDGQRRTLCHAEQIEQVVALG